MLQNKKRHGRPLTTCVAFILILSLLFTGCQADPLLPDILHSTPPTASSSPSTPSSPIIPSTPGPSIPSDNDQGKIVLNPAQLVYEMTDEDVSKFYSLLDQMKAAALDGKDGETVMALSTQIDDQYYYMEAQLSIATVLYYCDLNDTAASELYLECVDTLTDAYDTYMETIKELYDAQFPAKETFFADWTEQDIAMLLAYTPEVSALQERNSQIEVAYQDLQDDPNIYTKMVPLYIEMVQNNNRLAQIYGYDNYYAYAYKVSRDRDYGTKEIQKMRSLAARYLPDALRTAVNSFSDAYNTLSFTSQVKLESFMYDSYQNGYRDDIEEYFQTLPTQTQLEMLDMFNGNIIIADSPNAQEGAFTTAIGKDRTLCFFGPGYSSPMTIVHEVGHYYGAQHSDMNQLPLDLAEVQSQGNEWLFMRFMADKMAPDLYDAAVNYKLYNDIVAILLCIVIDEFEERVYTHPNVASLTSDSLDAIMEDICESYGGISFLNNVATDVQNYWRMVVVEQPVYYISYAVSSAAAINIFTIAEENYHNGVEVYCNLIENVVLEDGFLGNVKNAGLAGPFDEEFYAQLSAILK